MLQGPGQNTPWAAEARMVQRAALDLETDSGPPTLARLQSAVIARPRSLSFLRLLYFIRACSPPQLVLVDRGVLRPGDFFVSGSLWGSVRSIFDEEGVRSLECAGGYY